MPHAACTENPRRHLELDDRRALGRLMTGRRNELNEVRASATGRSTRALSELRPDPEGPTGAALSWVQVDSCGPAGQPRQQAYGRLGTSCADADADAGTSLSAMGIFLGFLAGVGASGFGVLLADRLSSTRERHTDLMATLDRAIESLVAGNHVIQQFIAKAGTGAPPPVVQEAADRVSEREIEMRAASASLRFRLGTDDPLVKVLDEAREHFVASYVATRPGLEQGLQGRQVMAPAFEAVHKFEDALETVIDSAGTRFGSSDRL
jgi:hypothetical protein